jgi:hypothetical protein
MAFKTYLLRGIPAELWARATRKAKGDGLTMKGLILLLLRRYADGSISAVLR